LLGYETLHGLWQLARSDCGFIRMKGAKELVVGTANAMVWVIRRNILGNGLGAHYLALGVRGIYWVAVGTANETVNGRVVGKATSEGVEGSVLFHKHNYVLDFLADMAGVIIPSFSVVVGIWTWGSQDHSRKG